LKKNNILIVHPISQFSGSLKSLEEYLKFFKKKYNFYFLIPRGEASRRLEKYGKVFNTIGLSKFDNSQLGYYRNIRWLLIFREIFFIFSTILITLKIKKKIKNISLIHFNEITLIPTIFIFRFFFNIPFILHCRILFKKDNYFGKIIEKFLKKNINQIIAIDTDVKKSLPNSLSIKVVRNIFVIKNFKKNMSLKDEDPYLNLGYIGTYLKYKGVEDLINVVKKMSKNDYKVRLFLGGGFLKENIFFQKIGLSNNIKKKIIEHKNIINLGHIKNLEKFYNKINVLCFPSYLNALGRQVFEAGLFFKPSIVCIKKTQSDSFINNVTGLSFNKPGSLNKLEQKIIFFYKKRNLIKKMGKKANALIIKNYDPKTNLKFLDKIYSYQINSKFVNVIKK
jgi:glycosyltransferase involved in cell wall biosynthesis